MEAELRGLVGQRIEVTGAAGFGASLAGLAAGAPSAGGTLVAGTGAPVVATGWPATLLDAAGGVARSVGASPIRCRGSSGSWPPR